MTKAIQYLKRVSKRNPDDLSIHARLSLLYLDSGEYDAATDEANYVFEQKPSSELASLAVFLKENALMLKENGSIVSLKQSVNRLSDIKNSYYLFAPLRKEEDITTKFFTENLIQPRINSFTETEKMQGNSPVLMNSNISLNDINIDSLREELFNFIKKEPIIGKLHSRNLQRNGPHFVTDFTNEMVEHKTDYKDFKVVSSQVNSITKDKNKKN